MYVCMYVCMYLSIYLSIYLSKHVCMYVCMYVSICASIYSLLREEQMCPCPVDWGHRICRLLLCRRVRSPKECPSYDIKQSDGEVPVMLKLWGMQGTPSLPSFPGPLWLGVAAPDRVLSMSQIELNRVLILNWIAWNRTVLRFKL